jgi:serine/threonine-protein kinase HipA
MSDIRILTAWYEHQKIGQLEDNNGVWSFIYDDHWLNDEQAFSLSPQLNMAQQQHIDNSTHRYVQWFFDNLLPEENARKVIADDKKLDQEDAFGLLTLFGAESAGALTLLKPGEPWGDAFVEPLSKIELSSRIKALPKSPLVKRARKKMSLAGAQHKMAIVYQQGEMFEPVNAMPSSHILKPQHEHPDDYWSTVCNEWFIMTLAAKVGLFVPAVYMDTVPEPVYIVERFDRSGEYPDQTRLHVLDACQLMGFYAGAKYRQSNAVTLSELLLLVAAKAQTRIRLFNWALFNALIGNGDAHLKNLSFHATAGGYHLTAHYDLLSTVIYDEQNPLGSRLSQSIGNAERFEQLSLDNLLLFAKTLGLPARVAKSETRKMCGVIMPAFDELYQQLETDGDSRYKGGNLRMLREIKYKVLKDMLAKLV